MTISVINDSWQRLAFGDPDGTVLASPETWVQAGTAINTDTLFFLSNGTSAAESLARNDDVGFAYDIGAGLDVSEKVLSLWILVNIAGFLTPIADGGGAGLSIFWAPDGVTWGDNTNTYRYGVGGGDTYFGGWEKFFIDPTKTDSFGKVPTIADLQACRYIGAFFRVINETVPGNVKNAFIDSIDVHDRRGLNIVGTSSDIFEDLYTIDTVNGTGTGGNPTGPIGIFSKENNIYLSNAKVLFGNGSTQTDVTGIGSVVVFRDPFYSGNNISNPVHPLSPLIPALEVGGLGYHISGSNTKVQFGQSNLVGGVTTITAGTQYELLMESTATGNFYASRFDEIGTYGGTGLDTTLRGVTYSGGGWDVTGDIIVPNSNYLFNTCQFNNCAQIKVNDGVFDGGFVTDFDAPVTGTTTGCDDLGAMKIDTTFDVTSTNFIGNVFAINFQESGSYPFNLQFSNNSDQSGNTPVDIINCTPNDVIVQVQGGDSPATGATSNPAGGTIDVQNVVTLTITGFVDNSELFARNHRENQSDPVVERFNEESVNGNYEYVYNAGAEVGSTIDLFIMKNQTTPTDTGYKWLSFIDFPLAQSNSQLFVTQIEDKNSNIF